MCLTFTKYAKLQRKYQFNIVSIKIRPRKTFPTIKFFYVVYFVGTRIFICLLVACYEGKNPLNATSNNFPCDARSRPVKEALLPSPSGG